MWYNWYNINYTYFCYLSEPLRVKVMVSGCETPRPMIDGYFCPFRNFPKEIRIMWAEKNYDRFDRSISVRTEVLWDLTPYPVRLQTMVQLRRWQNTRPMIPARLRRSADAARA